MVQALQDLVVRFLTAVDAAGGHRVEHVGDGADARVDVDLPALQTVRVAGAVHAFVVVQRHASDRLGDAGVFENRVAEFGVFFDFGVFDGGQLVWFVEDHRIDQRLADVMERAAEQDFCALLVRQSQPLRDAVGEQPDTDGVLHRVRVLRPQAVHEAEQVRFLVTDGVQVLDGGDRFLPIDLVRAFCFREQVGDRGERFHVGFLHRGGGRDGGCLLHDPDVIDALKFEAVELVLGEGDVLGEQQLPLGGHDIAGEGVADANFGERKIAILVHGRLLGWSDVEVRYSR